MGFFVPDMKLWNPRPSPDLATLSPQMRRRPPLLISVGKLPSRDYIDMHSATNVSCRRSRLGLAELAFLCPAYLVPRLLSPPTWIDHPCILTLDYPAHGFLFLGFKFVDSQILKLWNFGFLSLGLNPGSLTHGFLLSGFLLPQSRPSASFMSLFAVSWPRHS